MYATEKERDQDAQMSAFLREDSSQAQNSPNSGSRNYHNSPREVASDSNSPDRTVRRQDIRASAEKILYTFLLPGSEREITMPESITQDVTSAIEEYGRDDPEVFDVAKDYVFQAMERDAFPGFLRMKALGNLIPPTLVMRLVIGLISMFGGFWTAFILIFLDRDRLSRCWVSLRAPALWIPPKGHHEWSANLAYQIILPFTIGVYCLTSYQYTVDPVLALLGFSEYTPFNFTRIREPFVRKLLLKRSLMVLGVTAAIDAALCVLFILVPGKRL
jgi:hypothetical protein